MSDSISFSLLSDRIYGVKHPEIDWNQAVFSSYWKWEIKHFATLILWKLRMTTLDVDDNKCCEEVFKIPNPISSNKVSQTFLYHFEIVFSCFVTLHSERWHTSLISQCYVDDLSSQFAATQVPMEISQENCATNSVI